MTTMTTDTPRYWKKLVKLRRDEFAPLNPKLIAETMAQYKIDEAAAIKLLEDEHARSEVWANDLYQVAVTPWGDKGMLQINIRRRDGSMFKDWRHFQQIKNEVAGPEREAVELYPAESRKVDTANKWHLWVLPEGVQIGVGWNERDVDYSNRNGDVPGLRQRTL